MRVSVTPRTRHHPAKSEASHLRTRINVLEVALREVAAADDITQAASVAAAALELVS